MVPWPSGLELAHLDRLDRRRRLDELLDEPGSAFGDGVNWAKVEDTVKALVFSPLIGFVAAGLLLLAAKALLRNPALYQAPEGDKPPPIWIRALLVLTCTGVSFAHGSNDGQKGMGLIVLILVGIVPTAFALNLATSSADSMVGGDSTTFSQSLEQIPAARSRSPDVRSGTQSPDTVSALRAHRIRIRCRRSALPTQGSLPGWLM